VLVRLDHIASLVVNADHGSPSVVVGSAARELLPTTNGNRSGTRIRVPPARVLCTLHAMYVRWQKRKRSLVATLAENVRVNGKSVQQHVAYLGSIRQDYVSNLTQRSYFWEDITQRLNEIRLTGGERKRVRIAIAETIPLPTEREYAKLIRDLGKNLGIAHEAINIWR